MKQWIVAVLMLAWVCAGYADVWMGYPKVYDEEFWPDGQSGNYGVAKYFLDEDAGDSIDVTFEVDVYPEGGTITNVVLWSNIGRRDYARIYEGFADGGDPASSYYLGHEMTYSGAGSAAGHELYEVTLTVDQCGVFRATAYFQLDGDATMYWMNDFEDGGVDHRDICVVVSPKKVLDLRIYEANTFTVEALSGGTAAQRSTLEDFTSADADGFDPFNLEYVATNLYFNTLWLMPIHPITDERWYNTCATAPDACGYVGANYDPGSPYSTKNYWQVNEQFSDAGTSAASLEAFSNLCAEAEALGLNVFVDVAMNHAGRDCVFGQGAYEAGLIGLAATNTQIRDATPTWCTRGSDWSGGSYYFRQPAASDAEAATWAPADQPYRHQWYDAGVDWFFGDYSALGCYYSYCDGIGTYDDERDQFWTWTDAAPAAYEQVVASNVWRYFAYYVPYWLGKTGNKLDGIRADFAQGLPAQAWEYIINRTRQDKWDFVFLAEVLDDDPVRYRANRHFDLITTVNHYWFRTDSENMSSYRTILEEETDLLSYTAAIMWNGTSHDEDPGGADAWVMWSRYAIAASLYGVPMVYQGQALGVPNKINFESAWSNMYSYWTDAYYNDPERNACYRWVNRARDRHPALRGLNRYFLNTLAGTVNEDIYACARWTDDDDEDFPAFPFTSWGDGDIDLVFVRLAADSAETYAFPAEIELEEAWTTTIDGTNYLSTPYYQAYNLVSTNVYEEQWPSPRTAADIYANGVGVVFTYENEAQYIHLDPVECALEEIVDPPYKFSLDGLRKTRDIMVRTKAGTRYNKLYTMYSGEVAAMLLKKENATLLSSALYLTQKAASHADAFFNQKKDTKLSDSDIRSGISLLTAMRNRTKTAGLRQVLAELISRSQKVYGKTFIQALNYFISGT
ncbi:MAG: hypothetical protein KA248_09805 [Kiritimatiellae bacterium]|nr:hypothetical protein [Kiritimatiellia bacterium]